MTNITFKFYSIIKNEDAIPYIGDNLLVVADGLGGSGSTVHQIDRSSHRNMHSEIMSGIFGDISHASPEAVQYIEELIAPILEGEDATSALWASRIVIARCVYALTEGEFKDARLDDDKVRSELVQFISKGLHNTVEKFGLQKGKYDGQLLLPTTLAFIRYADEGDSVIAEAVWAGDSRLYALVPEGLKLLSVDDEDDSGAITNLFYSDNGKVRLNYLRHKLTKPCVLMAVSDGVFDPFDPHDHLGVEHTLLSAIAESDSEQELADTLHGFYDGVHGDDATMAFVSFGFADFADMKKILKERTDKILSIWQTQKEMNSVLEVMNLSEEEASHYVRIRTADRFVYIIPTLIDAIERGTDDVAITTELRSFVEKVQKERKAAAEKARAQNRKRAFDELDSYVLSHPEHVIPGTTNDDPIFNESSQKLYDKFKKAAEVLLSQKEKFDELKLTEDGLSKGRQELHQMIQERITKYRKVFDDLYYDQSRDSCKKHEDVCSILCVWYRIDHYLQAGETFEVDKILEKEEIEGGINDKSFKSEQELACTVKEYLDDRNLCKESYAAYKDAWKKLLDRLKDNNRFVQDLLTHEAFARFGFGESAATTALTIGESDRNGWPREFQDSIVSGIVDALAAGFDRSSVIDGQYNATKLDRFRTYYSLQSNPNNAMKEFEKELLALETEYTSLVAHGGL